MSRSVLRGALYAFGAVLAAAALLLLMLRCFVPAAWVGGWALLLLIGLAIEHSRYKPLDQRAPGPGWVRTEERFVDPETGKLVTVYFHPPTGERRYVTV